MKKKPKIVFYVLIFALLAFGGTLIEHFERDAFIMETTATEDDLPYTSTAESVIDGKININSADSSQLEQLHGIGAKMAERIITYREQNGPFISTEEIMKVSGISEKRYMELKDYICVSDE